MDWTTPLWHLINLWAAPLGVATLLLLLAKGLVWRAPLRALGWGRGWLELSLAGCAGQLAALLLLGGEGKLSAYALMLLTLVLPLGWRLSRA